MAEPSRPTEASDPNTDPAVVSALAAVAVVYTAAELALIRLLTAALDAGVDSSGWAVRRLLAIPTLRRAVAPVVERAVAAGLQASAEAVAVGYRVGHGGALERGGLERDGPARAAARGADAIRALTEALHAELRPVHQAILPATLSTYRHAVADATARVLRGETDQRRAAQGAWAALVDRGITSYTDTAGRRWRLHSLVEMAVRTAVARAVVAGQMDAFTAAGRRLVYVPNRPTTCPICAPYAGRVLALWGPTGTVAETNERTGATTLVTVVATVAEARAAGLWHPNCRHHLAEYRPGLTSLRPGLNTDPKLYDAEQRQRGLERQVRHWREREAAALTPDARRQAAQKRAGWVDALDRHTDLHDLPRRKHREQPGAGHVPPHRKAEVAALR